MSPLASYRRLFQLAGTAYVVVAFLARLPMAMIQLGTLLVVSGVTGSYALGGLCAGALAVSNAVASPVAGLLSDRLGQRHVVLVQALAGSALLVLLVVLVRAGAPHPLFVAAAALAGLATPQIGPLARVRWRPITAASDGGQSRLMEVAFAYEGAADEASFALGPALVGLAVVAFSPEGALVLAAGLLALFGTAFALHPTARREPHDEGSPVLVGRWISPVFGVLTAAQLLIGVLFGATQTGTTVLATAAGHADLTGPILATLAIGSALAGVATAVIPERIGPERRALGAAGALFVLSVPLLGVGSLWMLVAIIAVLGCAVAPFMIGVFTMGERVVVRERVSTAMTVLAGATGVGYAVGAAVAGRLADQRGHHAAFAVTVVAMGLAVMLVATSQRRLRAALARPAQAPHRRVVL